MRILFFTLHWGYLRNYQTTLVELAERGHEIRLLADIADDSGSDAMIDELCAAYPGITAARNVRAAGLFRRRFMGHLRHALNSLRFHQPMYARRDLLRTSLEDRMPPFVRWCYGKAIAEPRRLAAFQSLLRALESALPADRDILRTIREFDPDVVLLSPLVGMTDDEFDSLRAAQRDGRRNMLCVGSWDHLSSKAYVRFVPDRIVVWNEIQRDELERFHGVSGERVSVTGAQAFDEWFDREPVESERQFKVATGLDPERPFLVYLCSCLFHSGPPEPPFVVRWLRWLRERPESALREIGVLVRPHPERRSEWEGVDLSVFDNVVLCGATPVTRSAKDEYFSSMAHARLAMGLNSTALIEAGILGRPVHTILTPELADSQTVTHHFGYLTGVEGGLLHVTEEWEEHAEQLLASLALPEGGSDPRSQRFTHAFVRPFGLEEPATPRFLEQVERYGREPAPEPRRPPLRELAVRWSSLYPTMLLARVVAFAAPRVRRLAQGARLARRGLVRGSEWLAKRPLAIEKRLWPRALRRMRTAGGLTGPLSSRLRQVVGWARHDASGAEVAAAAAGDDAPGSDTVVPPAAMRWLVLGPLLVLGATLRRIDRGTEWIRRKCAKLVRLVRHQRTKERPVRQAVEALGARLRVLLTRRR